MYLVTPYYQMHTYVGARVAKKLRLFPAPAMYMTGSGPRRRISVLIGRSSCMYVTRGFQNIDSLLGRSLHSYWHDPRPTVASMYI